MQLFTWTVILTGLATLVAGETELDSKFDPRTCTSRTLRSSGGNDAAAFLAGVKECTTVVIPLGTTLTIASRLNMTGLSNKHIDLKGTVKFVPDILYWAIPGNVFSFQYLDLTTFWIFGGKNLTINGGGTMDGSGQVWWDELVANPTVVRPILFTTFQASGVTVENINMINSPNWFNLINESKHVVFNNMTISAATTSVNRPRNTDGWDTYRSDDVVIQNSVLTVGDDCVSFKPNSTNVYVNNVDCTGDHGVSVGSLGQYPEYFDIVENITATNVRFTNSQNGARIKAWAGPNVGSGRVKNVTFAHFTETRVDHPLLIDQCYFTNATACAEYPSNVFIDDVIFTNISGTSTGPTVVSLACSPDNRCGDIRLDDIKLAPPSGSAQYVCQNVNITGNSAGLFPNPCPST